MSFLSNLFSRTDSTATPVAGLTLYHFTTCPYCVRVRRAMKRLGVVVEQRNIHRSEEAFDQLVTGGGKKQVPCLHIQETCDTSEQWMYESSEIVDYLTARFG